MNKRMVIGLIAGFFSLLVLIIGTSLMVGYNKLVELDESVNGKLSQVDNRYQERKDKIDQLVDVVEAYTTLEVQIYTMITQAREAYAAAKISGSAADMAEASSLETIAVNGILAIVEDNPEITSDAVYIALMIEISSMESALSTARLRYNESVESYNTSARKFPRIWYVSIFDFNTNKSYWKIDDGAHEVPSINLGN